MKRLGLYLFAGFTVFATGQYLEAQVINNTVSVCNPSTPSQCAKPDSNGALPVTATITPSGTQNVNITQVGGNAVTTTIPISAPSAIPVTGSFTATTAANASATPPTYTAGSQPLSQDLNGNLRVTGSFSATTTANASATAPTYTAGAQPISQDLSGNLRTTLTTSLPAGSAIIGNVGIDQTTPGTTNGVQINAPLPAGSNVIGNVASRNGAAQTPTDATVNISTSVLDSGGTQRASVGSMPYDFNGTSWDRKRGDVNGSWTQGNVASGATDAGNPVKIGGVYTSGVLPSFTTGQRGNATIDQQGNLRALSLVTGGTGSDGIQNTRFGSGQNSLSGGNLDSVYPAYMGLYFNGTSWDRQRGDANGGTWVQPSTNSGTSNFSLIAAATTNSTNVKNAPGILTEITVYNNSTAIAYLKLYNAASAPTCGSGTPVGRYLIPGGTNGAGSNVTLSLGKAFSTGISFCITGAIGDADTTAVAANQYIVNMTYK